MGGLVAQCGQQLWAVVCEHCDLFCDLIYQHHDALHLVDVLILYIVTIPRK